MAFGREKGEVAKDKGGLNTDRNFGKKIAWLIKKTKEGRKLSLSWLSELFEVNNL
jgi:multimeric flavodoxin WrbA